MQKNLNVTQLYQQFQNNPINFLMQNRFSIPNGIDNSPQAIIQHLLDSGQITQQQVNQARQMLPQLNGMFNQR